MIGQQSSILELPAQRIVDIQHSLLLIVPCDIRGQADEFLFTAAGHAVPLEGGQAAGFECSRGHYG